MTISLKFSADTLQKAETALAQYIGAIAKVVVKRAAAKARDEGELYLLIADEIKDPAERKAFVQGDFGFRARLTGRKDLPGTRLRESPTPSAPVPLPAQTPISRRNSSAGVR